MGLSHSPKIVTSGLAYSHDLWNTEKSFKGAPTTNLYQDTFGATGTLDGFGGGSFLDTNLVSQNPFNTGIVYARKSNSGVATWSVQANLTAGVTYTYSIWCKTLFWTTVSLRRNEPSVYVAESKIVSVTPGVWTRVDFTFTVSAGKTGNQVVGIGVGDVNPGMDNRGIFLYGAMLEQRSFVTPYTNTSRSNTQVVLDLTNISTVTVNDLLYTSNNYATINGSNSYIAITNSAAIRPSSELTIEYVIKGSTTGSWRPILGYGNGNYSSGNYLVWAESGGSLNSLCAINKGGTVTEYRQYPGAVISDTTYQHMTFTMRIGEAIRSYRNGIDTNTPISLPAGGVFHYPATSLPYQVGGLGGSWLVADVPIVRLYNRALTAAETLQNFNAIRGRFGI